VKLDATRDDTQEFLERPDSRPVAGPSAARICNTASVEGLTVVDPFRSSMVL